MGIERGCLVLADISGYTDYLTGVELEHSHDVLADLLDTIVRTAEGVLTLSKLEGDAVFWFDRGEGDPAALLPTIDACYVTFRRRVRTIAAQTTCTCNACSRIPELDLKLVAHWGEFVMREIAGSQELVGGDVILVHRLLKNTVVEATGLRAYAFLTEPFLERCGFELTTLDLPSHVERYEDMGEVRGRVLDLQARWEAAEAERLAYVSVEESVGEPIEAMLAAPPAAIWEYLTNPRKRPLWTRGVKRIDQDAGSGIVGVGTTNHCVHGATATREEILDWKPFDYYTWSSRTPGGSFRMTCQLEIVDEEHTKVSWRAVPESRRAKLAAKLLWKAFRKDIVEGMTTIERLIAQDLAGASVGAGR